LRKEAICINATEEHFTSPRTPSRSGTLEDGVVLKELDECFCLSKLRGSSDNTARGIDGFRNLGVVFNRAGCEYNEWSMQMVGSGMWGGARRVSGCGKILYTSNSRLTGGPLNVRSMGGFVTYTKAARGFAVYSSF
jgi:hypothetical protein